MHHIFSDDFVRNYRKETKDEGFSCARRDYDSDVKLTINKNRDSNFPHCENRSFIGPNCDVPCTEITGKTHCDNHVLCHSLDGTHAGVVCDCLGHYANYPLCNMSKWLFPSQVVLWHVTPTASCSSEIQTIGPSAGHRQQNRRFDNDPTRECRNDRERRVGRQVHRSISTKRKHHRSCLPRFLSSDRWFSFQDTEWRQYGDASYELSPGATIAIQSLLPAKEYTIRVILFAGFVSSHPTDVEYKETVAVQTSND